MGKRMGGRLRWVSSLSLSQPFIEKFADKITDNFDNQYDTHTQTHTFTHTHITNHTRTDRPGVQKEKCWVEKNRWKNWCCYQICSYSIVWAS